MRIFRAISVGILGLVTSLIISLFLTSIPIIFGIFVFFVGAFAALHPILGYIDNKIGPQEQDRKMFTILAISFATIALMPLIMPCFTDFPSWNTLFVFIGLFGGYKAVDFVYAYFDRSYHIEVEKALRTKYKQIPLEIKLQVYSGKFLSLFKPYVLVIAIIFIIGFFATGLSISWIILIGILIFEAWRDKIWIITDRDLTGYWFEEKEYWKDEQYLRKIRIRKEKKESSETNKYE